MTLFPSPTLYIIKHQSCNNIYVVLDSPTESTLHTYVEKLVGLNVSVVIRCCQPTYDPQALLDHRIKVIDLPFEDDGVPSLSIIDQWLDLIKNYQNTVVAVHCISGLKRAPVLVAIALIESGISAYDTIEYMRTHRRDIFNPYQLKFLHKYHTHKKRNTFRSSVNKLFRL